MKLLIVTVVVVPWAAVVAVVLAVLHHGAAVGARLDAIHQSRPCPMCQASYQVTPPTRKKAETQ